MNIRLPFGEGTVPVDVPDNWINGRCYRSFRFEPTDDLLGTFDSAIDNLIGLESLDSVLKKRTNAVIAVDSTHWRMLRELLPLLLERILDSSSLKPADIQILFTNTLWNSLPSGFLKQHVAHSLIEEYPVTLHDPREPAVCTDCGMVDGNIPLRINSLYAEADLKIVLSVVEPNMLFGFNGGRTAVLPGLANETTLRRLYAYSYLDNTNIAYGVTRDNPLHQASNEALEKIGCDLGISVIKTEREQSAEIFAGDAAQATMAAIGRLREKISVTVKEPMDIVVTCGGGNPHDRTLFQLFSALSTTLPVLKPDGTIVVTAEMAEGFGPLPLRDILLKSNNPRGFKKRYSNPDNFTPGQWYAQRFFDILKNHEVIIYTDGIGEHELWNAGLTPTTDLQEAIEVAMQGHGQRCKICALPDGPFSLAQLMPMGM